MRKVKLASVFLLLALLVSAGVVQAQVTPPEEPGPVDLPGLDAPVSEWTDADLERLVDLIVSEEITIQQSKMVYKKLTEEQIGRVIELWGARVGLSSDEVEQVIARRHEGMAARQTIPEKPGEQIAPCQSQRYLWNDSCYPCEHNGDTWNQTLPNRYFDSEECGSNDEDWIFDYDIVYDHMADSLKWRTDDGQVWWAISLRYWNKNLNSFAYWWDGWDEVKLVVGKGCVNLVSGGVDRFEDHLILGQEHNE